ncbi:hypothetical protein EV361DRAFT_1003182 [Lentinula raphanica]|uniref:Signal sequence receptor subunit alpha n=1 Tax=Lentinula raphanica TaxID=153919 RepID=A0AA38PD36_9AGAR|nr:hypothetical protein F5880DRAFT_1530127 [Lentinula raphanica]KAJ3840698.1 hypothetical protein F5878DRAFT_612397 [Lentinula raphanica]KAJ3968570.1 hypothetical protein EV361DRAFT_1003182 [Lentinula raphanica]
MRIYSLLATALYVASFASFALGQDEVEEEQIIIETEDHEPQFVAAAAWPETNPFGHVVNGEKNTIGVLVENRLNRNTTLLNVAGAFYQPETDVLVRNLSAMAFNLELIDGVKLQLPYAFFSEFKPGELRLTVWVDHLDEGEKQRVIAYDSIVTIVEPEGSWFDFKLLSTYLVVSGLLGVLGYIAYLSFVPQPKRTRKAAVSAPVGTVTATGAGGYQEEWIPSHHLRKNKKKSGVASSGDELSGAETSGTEGKRRKGKK